MYILIKIKTNLLFVNLMKVGELIVKFLQLHPQWQNHLSPRNLNFTHTSKLLIACQEQSPQIPRARPSLTRAKPGSEEAK